MAGYAYSDWLSRRLAPRRQVVVHVPLLAASLLFLPIVASAHWKPTGAEDPTLLILGLLLATIGLPYFLLSTTGPLVQSWVARAGVGTHVYRYFSLSNMASLIALISYPFLIETRTALLGQAYGWSSSTRYSRFSVRLPACISCAMSRRCRHRSTQRCMPPKATGIPPGAITCSG